MGIDVFTPHVEPPCKVELLEVEISPEPGSGWMRRLVERYMEMPEITICATFRVPSSRG